MSRVLLVRHGETRWNRDRRIQGWAPTELSERGREQARDLGRAIANNFDVDRVIASDLPRATETAEIVVDIIGGGITRDRRWRERDFGFCQGLEYDEFNDRFPHLSVTKSGQSAVEARPESGETYREMFDRVRAAWEDVIEYSDPQGTTLVVSHGGPLYSLIGQFKGLDLVSSIVEQEQDNCAVNEIAIETGDERKPTIVRDNDTSLWREIGGR